MGNPFTRLWQVFSVLKYSKRTVALIATIAIIAAIPLTVLMSQQQQNTRQQASVTCQKCVTTTYCPSGNQRDQTNDGACTASAPTCCKSNPTTAACGVAGTECGNGKQACCTGFECPLAYPGNPQICRLKSIYTCSGNDTNKCSTLSTQTCPGAFPNTTDKTCPTGRKCCTSQAPATSVICPGTYTVSGKTYDLKCATTQPSGYTNLSTTPITAGATYTSSCASTCWYKETVSTTFNCNQDLGDVVYACSTSSSCPATWTEKKDVATSCGNTVACCTKTYAPQGGESLGCSKTFSDVPSTDPLYPAVNSLAACCIIKGYTNGTFKPGTTSTGKITRAQAIAFIVRYHNKFHNWQLLAPASPSFVDVDPGDAWYQEIETAKARGLIQGYPVTGVSTKPEFRPYGDWIYGFNNSWFGANFSSNVSSTGMTGTITRTDFVQKMYDYAKTSDSTALNACISTPPCDEGIECDPNKCEPSTTNPIQCGEAKGKKVNCQFKKLKTDPTKTCTPQTAPAETCIYNCDSTKGEACTEGICTVPAACNNNGVCEPSKGETTANCSNDCRTTTCRTSGQSCSTASPCCSGQNLTCTNGTCQTTTTTCNLPNRNPHFECRSNTCVAVNTCAQNSSSCSAAGGSCDIVQGNTVLSLTLGLDGIGTTGDNPNPTLHTSSNKNPNKKSRPVTVVVVDKSGNETTKNGQIAYDEASGSATFGKFKTTVDLGTLATGEYTVKVTSTGYLTTLVSSMVSLTRGSTTQAPSARLVTGNVNNEDISRNVLDIQDYNILIGCVQDEDFTKIPKEFSDQCNRVASNKDLSDLDDNGKVDKNDWNLWIRELSKQYGAQ